MKDILKIFLFVNLLPYSLINLTMISRTRLELDLIKTYLALHPSWVALYLMTMTTVYLLAVGGALSAQKER